MYMFSVLRVYQKIDDLFFVSNRRKKQKREGRKEGRKKRALLFLLL